MKKCPNCGSSNTIEIKLDTVIRLICCVCEANFYFDTEPPEINEET